MKFIEFIKINKIWITSYIIMITLFNCIIITSSSIDILLKDVLYINFLAFLNQIVAILIIYVITNRYYNQVFKSLKLNNRFKKPENYFVGKISELIQDNNQMLEKMQLQYESSIDDIQEYVTQWVHDIKLDIAICKLLLEESEEEQIDLVSQIEQVNFKVNQILQIIRAKNYYSDCIVEEFNINDEVKAAIKINEMFFISKNISISKNIKSNYIVNDRKWVKYILCQIINNCTKYTEKNGNVEIWLDESKKAYYLHIKDYGIGIPKEDLNRIFDKGFTGENGHSRNEASGMGLYYSKQIANKLNINIEVLSEKGIFTEFILTFYKVSDYYKLD